MRELDMSEVNAVSGGALGPAEGAALILTAIIIAPVGFAMGFGLAVAAGLLYAASDE